MKCRGLGTAKGYGCGKDVDFRRYGLGRCCLNNWLLNTIEGQKKLKKATLKAKGIVKRKYVKKTKEERQKLTDYKVKLQTKINEIVRLIDYGQPCLARGYHAKQIHAGHIFSRGAYPSMRFNLHNIHRQSAQSNHYQNEDGLLREGLAKEYGKDYFNFVSELRQTPTLKFSHSEYMHLYRWACKLALDLRKKGQTYNKLERIEMRNKLNLKLNIYELKHCKYEKI